MAGEWPSVPVLFDGDWSPPKWPNLLKAVGGRDEKSDSVPSLQGQWVRAHAQRCLLWPKIKLKKKCKGPSIGKGRWKIVSTSASWTKMLPFRSVHWTSRGWQGGVSATLHKRGEQDTPTCCPLPKACTCEHLSDSNCGQGQRCAGYHVSVLDHIHSGKALTFKILCTN